MNDICLKCRFQSNDCIGFQLKPNTFSCLLFRYRDPIMNLMETNIQTEQKPNDPEFRYYVPEITYPEGMSTESGTTFLEVNLNDSNYHKQS